MWRWRFWYWVRDLAQRQARAAYMRVNHHDRKCPVCLRWVSEMGGAEECQDSGEYFEMMQCKQCKQWSRWDCRSMLPVLASEQPTGGPRSVETP